MWVSAVEPRFNRPLYNRAVNPHVFKCWELLGNKWLMTSDRPDLDVIWATNTHWLWSMYMPHKTVHIKPHYCLNYNGMPEFMRNVLTVNNFKPRKQLKFLGRKVESTRNGKLRRFSWRFSTLIWRPGGTAQNLKSPGSGRVDSTYITKSSARYNERFSSTRLKLR